MVTIVNMLKELSVVIPLYNKEHTIKNTLETLLKSNIAEKLQLIIVENGSTDNSLQRANLTINDLSNNYDVEILISKKGKGNAIRAAIPFIKHEWCFVTGADLPFGLSEIDEFLIDNYNHDLYLGSKGHPNSEIKRKLTRVFYSYIFYLFRKLFLKMEFLDPHGSMIVKSKYLQEIQPVLTQEEFFIDTEIVFLLNKLEIKILEIPIKLINDDPHTTVKPLQDGLKILKETVKLGFKNN